LNRTTTLGDKTGVVSPEGAIAQHAFILTAKILTAKIPTTMFVAAISSPAGADEPFYLGTWKFDSAVVALWADPHEKTDARGDEGAHRQDGHADAGGNCRTEGVCLQGTALQGEQFHRPCCSKPRSRR